MKPYYEQDGITIYHGDCREVLASFTDRFQLTLTDPPYGINGGRGGTSRLRGRGNYEGAFTSADDTSAYIAAVVVPAIHNCIAISSAVIVTPGNKNFSLYPQPESFGVMWQPQGTGAQHWGWCDAQPIFYYGRNPKAGKLLDRCSWKVTESDECDNGHPCPKPQSFWAKLLQKGIGSVEAARVLDPFMGSGTTLRLAKNNGFEAVGIEIEERYCEIAAERLRQGALFGVTT